MKYIKDIVYLNMNITKLVKSAFGISVGGLGKNPKTNNLGEGDYAVLESMILIYMILIYLIVEF